MWTLGIETSGLVGSIALQCDEQLVAECALATAGRRHAQTLLAEIHDLLQSAAITPRDIGGIAVSLGPGSFTGLRIGVVCAKTWAYATGCRVVGIEAFATFATQAPREWEQLWVIGDAQRGDFFAAEYRRDRCREWQRETPLAIVSGAEWLAARSSTEHIIGPGVTRIAESATPASVIRDDWAVQPSAAAVAKLGVHKLQNGNSDDVWTLSPMYIRPSAAEEKRAMG